MAKLIEYDVSGVEAGGGGTGVKVKPGVYPAEIVRCEKRDSKKDGSPANDISLVLNVGEEYDWLFTYIGLSEAADWKLAEFTRAVGLKDKGKFDPDKMVGKIIRVKVNPGTYDGEYSPDVGRLMKAQPEDEVGGTAVPAEDDVSPDDGPDDDTGGGDAEPDKFYRENKPDPDDPDVTIGSYDEWPDDDLEAEVTDRGLTLAGGRASKKNKMINALRDNDASIMDAGEGGDDDTPPDEYDDWDMDQLKKEWSDREMGDLPAIRGRNAETRLQAALVEGLREDDNENPFT